MTPSSKKNNRASQPGPQPEAVKKASLVEHLWLPAIVAVIGIAVGAVVTHYAKERHDIFTTVFLADKPTPGLKDALQLYRHTVVVVNNGDLPVTEIGIEIVFSGTHGTIQVEGPTTWANPQMLLDGYGAKWIRRGQYSVRVPQLNPNEGFQFDFRANGPATIAVELRSKQLSFRRVY